MRETLAFFLLCILMFGCQEKITFSIDGQPHVIEFNP